MRETINDLYTLVAGVMDRSRALREIAKDCSDAKLLSATYDEVSNLEGIADQIKVVIESIKAKQKIRLTHGREIIRVDGFRDEIQAAMDILDELLINKNLNPVHESVCVTPSGVASVVHRN